MSHMNWLGAAGAVCLLAGCSTAPAPVASPIACASSAPTPSNNSTLTATGVIAAPETGSAGLSAGSLVIDLVWDSAVTELTALAAQVSTSPATKAVIAKYLPILTAEYGAMGNMTLPANARTFATDVMTFLNALPPGSIGTADQRHITELEGAAMLILNSHVTSSLEPPARTDAAMVMKCPNETEDACRDNDFILVN